MPCVDGWYWFPGMRGALRLEVDFGDGWVNVTHYWQGHTRTSGRRGPLDRFTAATLVFDLHNGDRRFSPWRAGPHGKPGRNMPVRLTARTATGLERVRFLGWTDDWRETAMPGIQGVAYPRVRVSCTDEFKRLARANGIEGSPVGAGELTGARIERILDEAGSTSDRFLDDGEVTMAATTLARPALDELHDTALADGGGAFFVTEWGRVTFYDRASIDASLDPVARFGNDGGPGSVTYGPLDSSATAAAVVNTVRIAKTGGTAFTAVDAASVAADGQLLFTRTDLGHANDSDSDDIAAALIARAVASTFAVGNLEVEPVTGGDVAWEACVGLGLTNPVSVAHYDQDVGEGFTVLSRIDAIVERVIPGRWSSTFTTSPIDEPGSFEVIGPIEDLAATVGYDTITWTWTIPAHGYDELWVSFDSGPAVPIDGATTTWVAGGLTPGTTHRLCVRGRKGLIDTDNVCLNATTTPAPAGPGDDGDFDIPDPPDDCAESKGWAWRLEELSPIMGVTFLDDGLWTVLLPSTWRPEWDYEPLTWYRLTWQLYCAGAPEGDPLIIDWMEPADWDEPCDFDPPPTPTPVFALEVCAPTASVKDTVTDFPVPRREGFQSPRPGPFETDVGVLCSAGFDPAPVASGYLVDAELLGVQVTIVEPPQLTLGLFVNFDSEPSTICPLIRVGANGEVSLVAIPDASETGIVRFYMSVLTTTAGRLDTFFAVAGAGDQIPIAGWHSVAVTYGWEGSDAKARLYIDGAPSGAVATLTGDWYARDHNALVVWGGEPNSSFAHPAAWDQVLDASEISDIFTPAGPVEDYDTVVLADGPIGYWTMGALDSVPGSAYDELVLLAAPIGYWTLDAKDSITYAAYDVAVLGDAPIGYWKMDAKDTATYATYDAAVLAKAPASFWPMGSIVSSTFQDATPSDRDLTIATPGDWTIHSSDLPNGDNSASLNTSLFQNAVYSDISAFGLTNGSGPEAKTFEAWVKITANTNTRLIFSIRTDGTGVGNTRHIEARILPTEQLYCRWLTTSDGEYLDTTSGVLSAGWHHIVVIFNHGSTRSIVTYIDGVADATDTSTSGTPTYSTTATYLLYVGAERTTNTAEMTDHMAKFAVYSVALNSTQIAENYTEMTT